MQSNTSSFSALVEEYGLLFVLATLLTLMLSWARFRDSYRHRHGGDIIIQCLFTALVTAALSVASVMLLPLVLHDDVSYEARVGITVYICVFGMKGIDMFARKFFGFSVIDATDMNDVRQLLSGMSPDQRTAHTEECPFRDECNVCRGCDRCSHASSRDDE